MIDSGGALHRLYLSYPLIHLHKDEDNIRKSGELRAVSAVAAPGSNYSILLCPVDSSAGQWPTLHPPALGCIPDIDNHRVPFLNLTETEVKSCSQIVMNSSIADQIQNTRG